VNVDIVAWIERTQDLKPCTTADLLYDHMKSQSDECLPLIYQPFDVDKQSHWMDRGWLFDYLSTTGGGKVLDFGPGDGWPSLILAPFVDEVIGVDGSRRRVQVCGQNAQRLGITNARFVYVRPGEPLPFEEGSFDAVTAASSVEQTPDPYATLCELYRVLRLGGHLRIGYESLGSYRGDAEREAWLLEIDGDTSRLVVYDRHIDEERVDHYGLTLDLSREQAQCLLVYEDEELSVSQITESMLEEMSSHITDAMHCPLTHASGQTLGAWLKEIGFGEVLPSYAGAWLAWRLFDEVQEAKRPRDMTALDAYLEPIVRAFVQFAAPIETDPMITAVK
jgi:ubiquinone/menaquinone biosynthesis C-methylase UbiE